MSFCVPIDLQSALPYLQDELYDIRGKWYDIGVQIGIDTGTLQTIRNDFNDSGDALRELLTHWLKRTPTWEALLKALRSKPVGASDIASKLQKEMKDQLVFPEMVPEGNYNTIVQCQYRFMTDCTITVLIAIV